MRHRRKVKHFSRKSGPRKALLRGLVLALVENERISTTVEKAKELRRHVERAITIGKKDSLASRRLLLSRFPHQDTVYKIVTQLSPRFKERKGGYTRIIKIGRRPGDSAEMAFIEFVDFDYQSKQPVSVSVENKDGDSKVASDKIEKAKLLKAHRAINDAKKARRKIQNKSRAESRA